MCLADFESSYAIFQHNSIQPDWENEVWDDNADDDVLIDDDADTSTSDVESNFDEDKLDDPFHNEASSEIHTRRDAPLHDGFQVADFQIRDSEGLRRRYEAQSDPKLTHPQHSQQRTLMDPKATMSDQQSDLDSGSPSQKSQPKQRNFRRLNPAAPKPQYGEQLTRNYQVTRTGDNPRRRPQWDPLLGRFIIAGHRRRSVLSSDQDEYPDRKHRIARSIFGGSQQKPQPALDPQPASPPRPGRQLARKGQLTRTGDNPRNYQEGDHYGRIKQRYRRRSALVPDQNLELIDSFYMVCQSHLCCETTELKVQRRHEELRQPVTLTPLQSPQDKTLIPPESAEKNRTVARGIHPRFAPYNNDDSLKNHHSNLSPQTKQDQDRSREQSIQTVPEWTLRPPKAQKSSRRKDSMLNPWNSIIFSPDGFKHPESFFGSKGTSYVTDAEHTKHGAQATPKTEGTSKEQGTQTDPEKVLRPAKLKTRLRPIKADYEDHPADELAKTPLHDIPEDKPVTQFPTPRATPELMRYRRIKSIKAFSDKLRQRWKERIEKGGSPEYLLGSDLIQQYRIVPKSLSKTIQKDQKLSLEELHSPPSSPRRPAPTSPLSPLFPSQSSTSSKAVDTPQNTKDLLKGAHAPPPLPSQTLRQPHLFKNSILAWKRKRNDKRPH